LGGTARAAACEAGVAGEADAAGGTVAAGAGLTGAAGAAWGAGSRENSLWNQLPSADAGVVVATRAAALAMRA
jgi:hypothetical protein